MLWRYYICFCRIKNDETVIFQNLIFLIGEDTKYLYINGDNNHRGVLINNGGGGLTSGFTIFQIPESSEFEMMNMNIWVLYWKWIIPYNKELYYLKKTKL